jgi:hypothetical protein
LEAASQEHSVDTSYYVLHPENPELAIGKVTRLRHDRWMARTFKKPWAWNPANKKKGQGLSPPFSGVDSGRPNKRSAEFFIRNYFEHPTTKAAA